MQQAPKRLLKDFSALHDPAEGIFAKLVNDDMRRIYLMLIGPKDSPYEGCPFFFSIEPYTQFTPAADGAPYPYNPPKVLHYSPYSIRVHPNLYTPDGGGKVCLSILGTWAGQPWVPLMSFTTIAQTILGILDHAPLRNEPGYEHGHNDKVLVYTDYVQYVCLREAVERVFIPILKGVKLPILGVSGWGGGAKPAEINFLELFKDEIATYVLQHKDNYLERLNRLYKRYLGKKIEPSAYGDHYYKGEPFKFNEVADKLRAALPAEKSSV